MLQTEKCGSCAINTVREKLPGKVKWTGTPVEFVELVYAVHEAGSFNNGDISLKDLFESLGGMLDMEVRNFSRIFVDIQRRIKNRTVYLDELKVRLIHKMNKADEGRCKKGRT
jgi:hypothetical protein